jgi:hypothetical protein
MTKCPPPPKKKVKIKKLFSNVAKSYFFVFNFYCFKGHFVTKVSVHLGNQHKILDFFIPNMTYLKKKKFHLSEGPILTFIKRRP